ERAEKRKREERRADDLARVEAMNGLSLEELDAGVDECRALFETEQGRGQSVEARLTSIIGLASAAAAVTVGALTTQLGKGSDVSNGWVAPITSVISLYVVAQLLCALLSAVSGLQRRGYLMPDAEHLLLRPAEHRATHRQRQMCAYLEYAHDHYAANSDKVDQMAVGQRAFKN